jgi:hypothetical protein
VAAAARVRLCHPLERRRGPILGLTVVPATRHYFRMYNDANMLTNSI